MKAITNEAYWAAYWGLGRPVRAARLRRAVKMANAPADHEGMQRAIAARTDDMAPRSVYADMLDEDGFPFGAAALRGAVPTDATLPETYARGNAILASFHGRHRAHPKLVFGTVLYRAQDGRVFAEVTPGVNQRWNKQHNQHDELPEYKTTDLAHVRGLVEEMEPLDQQLSQWHLSRGIGTSLTPEAKQGMIRALDESASGPAQLAHRPVRNSRDTLDALRRAVSEKYRTKDVAPLLIYADAVQEAGHDVLADAIRRGVAWENEHKGRGKRKSPLSTAIPTATAYGRSAGPVHPIVYLFGPRDGLVRLDVGQRQVRYDTTDTAHLRDLIGQMEPHHERSGYYGSRDQLNQARRTVGLTNLERPRPRAELGPDVSAENVGG